MATGPVLGPHQPLQLRSLGRLVPPVGPQAPGAGPTAAEAPGHLCGHSPPSLVPHNPAEPKAPHVGNSLVGVPVQSLEATDRTGL